MASMATIAAPVSLKTDTPHFMHNRLDLTTLPAEILLSILELLHTSSRISKKASTLISYHLRYESNNRTTSSGDKPRGLVGLLAASRLIAPLARAVLYRTVVLESPRAVALFAKVLLADGSGEKRNAAMDSDGDVAQYVRVLKISLSGPYERKTLNAVVAIVKACTRVISLCLSSDLFNWIYGSMLSSYPNSNTSAQPPRLTLSTYPSMSALHPFIGANINTHPLLINVTHLRISHSQLDGFVQPLAFLRALGPMSHLSHLSLTRRVGRNEDNDRIFAENIISLHDDGYEGVLLQLLAVCFVWDNGASDLYSSRSSSPFFPSSANTSESGEMEENKPLAFIYTLLAQLSYSKRFLAIDIDASVSSYYDGRSSIDPKVHTPINDSSIPCISVPASLIGDADDSFPESRKRNSEDFWQFAERQISFKKQWLSEIDA